MQLPASFLRRRRAKASFRRTGFAARISQRPIIENGGRAVARDPEG
jgi:hypothetical protein